MSIRRLHVAGVLIMMSWFVSLAWLVQRQYYSNGYPPGITTSDRLAPGSRFYAVYAGGEQIGTASLTADTLPGGARIVQRLDIGARDSLESQLQTLTLTPALAVRTWTATITGGGPPMSVTGERDSAGQFRAMLSEAGRPVRTLAMDPGSALPLFSAALRSSLSGILKPGEPLSLPVLDPFSGTISTLSMRSVPVRSPVIVADSARLDPGSGRWVPALMDTVEARLLIQLESSAPVWLWVDRQGFPLRAELPNGLVYQRTAFEIAHLNFRNGFPASVPKPAGHRGGNHVRPDLPVPGDTAASIFFPSTDSAIVALPPLAWRGATTRADSAAQLTRWISRHIKLSDLGDDPVTAAEQRRGSALARARLLVAALRGRGIPARLAIGAERDGDHWTARLLPQAYADHWLTADIGGGRLGVDSTDRILATRTSGLRFEYDALLASLEKPTP